MTLRISSFAPWDLAKTLDDPVWVDVHLGRGDDGRDRVRTFFAPPDADPSATPIEGAQLLSLWTALRSVPRGDDLIVNPAADGELLITDEEIDGVLGGDRATASILSFRQRAIWGSRWVLMHLGPTGRFVGTIDGMDDRQALPLWTDRAAADAATPAGANVGQAYLLDVIAGGDDIDYLVDPQWGGLYIDRGLRSELMETAALFPAGYFAQLGELKEADYLPFFEAGKLAVGEARTAGRPFRGLWVIGYQLESAPPRVVFVVDADDLDATADIVVDAINRQERRLERTETVLLRDLSPESQEFVRRSTDLTSTS
ncbi:MAG: hypothetical protein ABJA11_00775 [Pseudolysinimonas sp.]